MLASVHHFPGAVRSDSAVAGIMSRDRVIVAGCVFLVTALAWTYLIRLDQEMASIAGSSMMERMSMPMSGDWSAREFLYVFAMWSVMMIGMMTPSALPVILLFTQMKRPGSSSHALLFGAAHISIWIAFSALAASLQWMLHQASLLSAAMIFTSAIAAGLTLVGAGIYQLTPAKSRCLTRCQSPLGFLMTNWREGPKGAVQLGVRHGLYCLGCCWALMLVLFVVGVMNLAWVAALTAFILLEKFGPAGAGLAKAGGAAMIAMGIFAIAA
jgi:predicted metal-binding membrane protein